MSASPFPQVSERRARKLLRAMLTRPRMLRQATALFAPDLGRREIAATVETAERMLARTPLRPSPPELAPPARFQGDSRLVLARDDVWELVEAFLLENPEARSPEVVAHLREHGPLPYAESTIRVKLTAIRKRLGIEIKPGFPPRERVS